MKTIISRLLIAVGFAVAAWLSRSESMLAARVADARQDLAVLHHDDLDTLLPQAAMSDYFAGDRRGLSGDIRIVKATAAYWLGRYGAVTADTTESAMDAQILLTAANAAFREAQSDPAAGSAAVQRLDGVLQAYAAALKASPRHVEAAYNYEYVARIRDQVARSPQGRIAKSPASAGPVMGGDLPAGPTIHGAPGAPPPDAKMEELQTIAPMEYGDREAQPEATPGAKRERKG
jgi:hypothetical protein